MNVSRISRFLVVASLVCGLLFASASVASALPVVIPNFAVDPSGAAFTIGPVSKFAAGSTNLVATPSLTFGAISEPGGTLDTLKMSWDADVEGGEAQAGWELVFGADPNLFGEIISLDIEPPGGWLGGNVGAIGGFAGILSAEVRALDFNGSLAGGWGFNTDQAGALPLANDVAAAGLASLENNQINTVIISVGVGPAAGSASVTNLQGAFIAPNYTIAGNGNWGNILTLQFFENGVLQGGQTFIPGQSSPGLNNYWRNILVTPEPSSLILGCLALIGLLGVRRRS